MKKIQSLDNSNLKMRLIGYSKLDYFNTENKINASTPFETILWTKNYKLFNR